MTDAGSVPSTVVVEKSVGSAWRAMIRLPRATVDMGAGVSLGVTGPPEVNGHGVVVVKMVRVRRVIVILFPVS